MTTTNWERIPDKLIRHIWVRADDDECGEGPDSVGVSPDWYADMGSPIHACGEDMLYSHTEIQTPWISVQDRIPPNDELVLCWTGQQYDLNSAFAGFFPEDYTHWMPLPCPPSSPPSSNT